ncbi:MAG: glycosyltransferase [Candidatus Paceibacterota bacterium]
MYFSIIIPTLNRPSDVKKMLDSILASSLLPSQIIIIDQSDNNATKKLITEMDIDIVDYHHFSIKSLTQAKNY